jgi:hypothetical protein
MASADAGSLMDRVVRGIDAFCDQGVSKTSGYLHARDGICDDSIPKHRMFGMCEVYLVAVHGFSHKEINLIFDSQFSRKYGVSHVSSIIVDGLTRRFGEACYFRSRRVSKFVGLQFSFSWLAPTVGAVMQK